MENFKKLNEINTQEYNKGKLVVPKYCGNDINNKKIVLKAGSKFAEIFLFILNSDINLSSDSINSTTTEISNINIATNSAVAVSGNINHNTQSSIPFRI